jgi:hypothetical protein
MTIFSGLFHSGLGSIRTVLAGLVLAVIGSAVCPPGSKVLVRSASSGKPAT